MALSWAWQGGVDWDDPARASIRPKSSGKEAGQPLDCPGQQGAHLKACVFVGGLGEEGIRSVESSRSRNTSVSMALRASAKLWGPSVCFGVGGGGGGETLGGMPPWQICSRKGLAYQPVKPPGDTGQWSPQGWGGLRALKEWQGNLSSSIGAPASRLKVLGACAGFRSTLSLSVQGSSASPCSVSNAQWAAPFLGPQGLSGETQ